MIATPHVKNSESGIILSDFGSLGTIAPRPRDDMMSFVEQCIAFSLMLSADWSDDN